MSACKPDHGRVMALLCLVRPMAPKTVFTCHLSLVMISARSLHHTCGGVRRGDVSYELADGLGFTNCCSLSLFLFLSLSCLPVGKSGAGMCAMSCRTVIAGSAMSARKPATTSLKLCGGMFVAMPTAIPEDPLTSRWGTLAGSTDGSSCTKHISLRDYYVIEHTEPIRAHNVILTTAIPEDTLTSRWSTLAGTTDGSSCTKYSSLRDYYVILHKLKLIT